MASVKAVGVSEFELLEVGVNAVEVNPAGARAGFGFKAGLQHFY